MVVPDDSGADGSAGSAKRERKGLHAGIKELDFELPIADGHGLADELIESLLGNCADALVVDVDPMSRTRQLPIHEYAEPHRGAWLCRSHDKMQIAGVKPVGDASTGLVQHGSLSLDRPLPRQRPIIQAQPRGERVDAWLVEGSASRRCEVLGALVAHVVFARPQVAPIGCRFNAATIHYAWLAADLAGSGLCQQFVDDHFRLFVRALAEVMMPDTALRIEEIERRPILVAERAPYDVVVVDGDRVVDPQLFNGPAHVHEVFFKRELRGVDADDHQPLIFVFLGPCANVGKRAQPVDAGVGPEVDQYDFAAQGRCRQRWRIEPFVCTLKRGQLRSSGASAIEESMEERNSNTRGCRRL